MKSEQYQIQINKINKNDYDSPHTVFISEGLFNSFRFTINQKVRLVCGMKDTFIHVTPLPNTVKTVEIPNQIWNELFLPDSLEKIRISYLQESNTLELGPFLGVFTQIGKNGFSHHSLREFCDELYQFAQANYLFLYVFSRHGWNDVYVEGFIQEKKSWIKSNVPTPSVVYNRIHSRLYENSTEIQQLFSYFKEIGIPFYNDHFLNKWEVHQILEEFEYICPYLPKTLLCDGLASLTTMLENYETVFLKPVHGSQGKEIYRIKKGSEGWLLDHSSLQGLVDQPFPTIKELYQSLRERMKKQRFIVQEGLSLLQHQGRPLDFRILCHRHLNSWKIVSSVARISNPKQFVSNIAKGGEQRKIMPILQEHFEKKHAIQIKNTMLELSLEVAELIANETNGHFAEFGVDIALDTEGFPWIIEINTKPSKKVEEPTRKIRPSAKAIIHHCYDLSR